MSFLIYERESQLEPVSVRGRGMALKKRGQFSIYLFMLMWAGYCVQIITQWFGWPSFVPVFWSPTQTGWKSCSFLSKNRRKMNLKFHHSYKVAQTLINWRKPPLLHFSCLVRAGTPSSKRCLLCLVQGHLCSGSDVCCQSHLHSPAQTLLIRLLCNLVLWGEMTQHSIH